MVSIGELTVKAYNFVSLLALMLVIWPWSMIKYFLPKNKKDITGEVCTCTYKHKHSGVLCSKGFLQIFFQTYEFILLGR